MFDIREGEYRTAFLMQLNIFLLISTLLIVKPAVNALFLSKFGAERLPEAFILVAVAALLISTLYARLLDRLSLNKIIEGTLVISFVALVSFVILLQLNVPDGLILYLFYVWTAIFAVLAGSQFWVLANLVYNVREAKRLFGFIGSGAIAGGIFGGYLTSVLAPVIGSENVLFLGASLLLICIPVSRTIWTENVSHLSLYRRKKRFQGIGEHPIRTIINSRHLTYLACIIGISVIVAKLVDFQFNDMAHRAITDPDELAAFLGFWFSNLNLLSLFVQLFFTARVVGTLGIGISLLFLPLGILLGATTLLIFPELWAAVLLKTADGSLKQSINKSATELLALPIPQDIKNKTKTFIDVVIDSTATGVAGVLLIFIVNAIDFYSWVISLSIILLIGVWIYLAYKVRIEYLRSFKLQVQNVSNEQDISQITDPDSILQGIEDVLKAGSEKQILYILSKVQNIQSDSLADHIYPLLEHDSPQVRAEAIRTLYFLGSQHMVEKIRPLIYDPSYEVKMAAFEYLFEYSSEETIVILDRYLDHNNLEISDAALASLALETRNNPTLKNIYKLEQRIDERLGALELSSDSDASLSKGAKLRLLDIVSNAGISDYYSYIETMLAHEDPEVKRKAILSAGRTLNPDFIDPLISFLADKKYLDTARKALINYNTPAIDPFISAIKNRAYPIRALRNLPSVIEKFDSQQAVVALFDLLDDQDQKLRVKSVRALNNMKTSHPELVFNSKEIARHLLQQGKLYLETLSAMYAQIIVNYRRSQKEGLPEQEDGQKRARRELIDLLEKRLDMDLELIFGLLELKYPAEEVNLIYNGVRSNKPEQQNNAIEFLDNLLEPDLKRVLIPVVEMTVLDSVSEEVLRSHRLKIPSEKECFEMLLEEGDLQIKLAVLKLISELEDKKYLTIVKSYSKNNNTQVRQIANKALSKILER
ncbi:MFS transporter [Aliifodinibius salicampi]|uniref:ADP,ATP carrier protein n=1 Tax=Fodinibius salicampi TaxID=1920655 RepID=A0ABT3Q112_9BACT|nr:Npt1/Npt2 family nucleotide transporter [Fodinibius salicampi]MCW9713765.1 MFS transporter [Fodinibius salicampi]